MEQLYQDFKGITDFFIVYISEAHAVDDPHPVPYAKKLGIKEHVDLGQRCAAADKLIKDKKLTIPFLVDNMDNQAAKAYRAWPDRIYLMRTDGTLAVAANRGPWGFKPALEAAAKWLADYKQTGVEPPPIRIESSQDKLIALREELFQAYRSGDYQKALQVAQKLHEQRPGSVDAAYNIACMHCLLGHEDEAYTWLEKALKAGYDDADHLEKDDDFKSIRDQDRFKSLVQKVREKNKQAEAARAERPDLAPVLGQWEMRTEFQGNNIEATMTLHLEDGELAGVWRSGGREMNLTDLVFEGDRLSFKRIIPGGPALEYEGNLKNDRITGHYDGPFGKLPSNGQRIGVPSGPPAEPRP